MIDFGDTVTLAAECRDAAGSLANAAVATLTVTLPDATTVTPAPANPPAVTGRYSHPYETSQAGRYTARWMFSGGVPAQAWTDVFDVAPASPIGLVGLDEMKHRLNIKVDNTVHDEQLRGLIASVTDVIEGIVGVVVRRTITETHSGRGEPHIVLRQRPAISVTSVVEDGVAVDASDYSLGSSGLLTRKSAYRVSGCWARGVDNVTVAYVAGRQEVRASVLDGATDLIRINWRPLAGGNHSVFDQGRGDDFGQRAEPGEIRLGFFVPNTVMQRLQPHARGPLVA